MPAIVQAISIILWDISIIPIILWDLIKMRRYTAGTKELLRRVLLVYVGPYIQLDVQTMEASRVLLGASNACPDFAA
jgi:hypothetical protein